MLRMWKVTGFVVFASIVSACSPSPGTPATRETQETSGFWRTNDQQVSLKSFGYWGGSFEWVASRDALTREQSEALSGLKFVKGSDDCVQDVQEYSLVVLDSAGQERNAIAREGNASCGSRVDILDIETLMPLLASLDCVGTGEASTELSSATTIHADDGCRHGFFSYQNEKPRWLKVVPSRPGRLHTFKVSHCAGKATGLELFDESGTVLLAKSSAEGTSDAECATLTPPLDAERGYTLRVTSQAVSRGGHVLLEVRGE